MAHSSEETQFHVSQKVLCVICSLSCLGFALINPRPKIKKQFKSLSTRKNLRRDDFYVTGASPPSGETTLSPKTLPGKALALWDV
jgi:hypothetical protein